MLSWKKVIFRRFTGTPENRNTIISDTVALNWKKGDIRT